MNFEEFNKSIELLCSVPFIKGIKLNSYYYKLSDDFLIKLENNLTLSTISILHNLLDNPINLNRVNRTLFNELMIMLKNTIKTKEYEEDLVKELLKCIIEMSKYFLDQEVMNSILQLFLVEDENFTYLLTRCVIDYLNKGQTNREINSYYYFSGMNTGLTSSIQYTFFSQSTCTFRTNIYPTFFTLDSFPVIFKLRTCDYRLKLYISGETGNICILFKSKCLLHKIV